MRMTDLDLSLRAWRDRLAVILTAYCAVIGRLLLCKQVARNPVRIQSCPCENTHRVFPDGTPRSRHYAALKRNRCHLH
jgi:hypothetical protein